MTFEQLMREPKHLLLKSISGNRAYNLAPASSGSDIRGIFVLPQRELYGLSYTDQVANESNDETFFELGKFMGLLCRNDPDMLELIGVPENCILVRHQLMQLIRPEDFLSRWCLDTFVGYAKEQLKKAKGDGKNYRAENMMHSIRLLNMAEEIARYKRVVVYREDREFLLRIRGGEFGYEELMDMVEGKMLKVEEAYRKSDLPDAPEIGPAEELLVRIREEFYQRSIVHAVSIHPYDPGWPKRAGEIAVQLKQVLGENLIRVEHIGSTSVPGLSAKPVIDLIPIVRDLEELDQQQHLIKALGYEWRGAFGISGRRFCPLTSPSGERVVHLHFFQEGAVNILRHLAFRDYLRAHPQIAREYEAEKRRAARLHPADSLAYNDEKAAWVQKYEKAAVEWYEKNADIKNKSIAL
ncbi:GrpB family protein [Puia sp. P3]|uniref:GrpB family protein n=1 Tax=Puia sp. P3 TaxID=3423952 RepID=UPI003D67455D